MIKVSNKSRLLAGLAVLCLAAVVMVAQYERNPLPDFTQYQHVGQKKMAFFDYMLPLIVARNQQILQQRSQLEQLAATGSLKFAAEQQKQLAALARQYGLGEKSIDSSLLPQLLLRVDLVPPSLALAQAAIESAWGTSRFAVQGNNLFGQWCYKKGCGLVPLKRRSGGRHEVAKFATVAKSVNAYIYNINTHSAYRDLRISRANLRRTKAELSGAELAQHLLHYSELREAYVHEVQAVIRVNKLVQYDRR